MVALLLVRMKRWNSNGRKSKQSGELFARPGVIAQTFCCGVGIVCACVVQVCWHRSSGANPSAIPPMSHG